MDDELTKFTDWWMKTKKLRPPSDAYNRVAGSTGTTLYRKDQFQVQLFINDPNYEIVDHLHPNVDSYEIYLSGAVYFRLNKETLLTPEQVAEAGLLLTGKRIRVRPDEWHGATVGATGGSFLSIQHWLNGVVPSSVHLDWAGPPIDAGHQMQLIGSIV